jgi:hypothetical protein
MPHNEDLELKLPITDHRLNDRVRRHTASHVNDKIDRLTASDIERSAHAGRDAVVARLAELDREWDIDRALMVNFAVLGGVTHELGERHNGWKYFFRVQMGFLLVHAIVGWCPPVLVFRRLGFRTSKEIAAERSELVARLETLPSAA